MVKYCCRSSVTWGNPRSLPGNLGSKLGCWHQYQSGGVGKDLELSIETIDEEKARTLIRENPHLGRPENGEEPNEDDVILSLRKKIHLQIWQRFDYELLDRNAAVRIDRQEPAEGRE